MKHDTFSVLLNIFIILHPFHGFMLIDDPLTSLSGWPTRLNAGTTNTDCGGPSSCVRLGWNGDEGYIQRSIQNIAQYTDFSFQFYIYQKSSDPSGQTSDDYCYFQYQFDNDGSWITLTTHRLSDLGTTNFPSLVNPGGKTVLHIRFSTASLEDNENCYLSAFKLSVQTSEPTLSPTNNPSISPTNFPTSITTQPTFDPTNYPTAIPTIDPTKAPTNYPTSITTAPSNYPTKAPVIDNMGVIETTDNSNELTVHGKINDNNESISSFLELILFLIIISVSIGLIFCFLIYLTVKKKKQMKLVNENNMNAIELEKVTSISTDGLVTPATLTETNETIAIEKTDLYNDYEDELKNWLNSVALIEYYNVFIENGFGDGNGNGMNDILELSNDDLKDMGISKLAHRKRILRQIEIETGKRNAEGTTDVNTMNSSYFSDDSDNGDELFQDQQMLSNKTATKGDESDDEDSDRMYDKSGNKITKGNKI